MIVACEACSAKFRLDESRLKPDGVKIRCSTCQHLFVVRAPPSQQAPAAPPTPRPVPPSLGFAFGDPNEETAPDFHLEPGALDSELTSPGRPSKELLERSRPEVHDSESPAIGGDALFGDFSEFAGIGAAEHEEAGLPLMDSPPLGLGLEPESNAPTGQTNASPAPNEIAFDVEPGASQAHADPFAQRTNDATHNAAPQWIPEAQQAPAKPADVPLGSSQQAQSALAAGGLPPVASAADELEKPPRASLGMWFARLLVGVGLCLVALVGGLKVVAGDRLPWHPQGWLATDWQRLFAPAPLPTLDELVVVSMRSSLYPTRAGKKLLVFSGEVENRASEERAWYGITATLYDEQNQPVASQQAPLVREVPTAHLLAHLTDVESLEQLWQAHTGEGAPLAPQQRAEFLVVLLDPPPDLEALSHRVALFKREPPPPPEPADEPATEADSVLPDPAETGRTKRWRKNKLKGKRWRKALPR